MKIPELKTTAECFADALAELKDTPSEELRAIEKDLCFHTWYRKAACKILEERQ